MEKLLEATREASTIIDDLLDDVSINFLRKDLEHLQNQITIIENSIKEIKK